MRIERRQGVRNKIRLEVKRSTELWLYSFADMYMIIAVLFIATTALYAKKAQKQMQGQQVVASAATKEMAAPSAGRGPAAASVQVAIEFQNGSTDLNEEALENLQTILPLLSEVKSGYVEIEGYSDEKAMGKDSKWKTNLELSSNRAVRVAEWFLNHGIGESRMRTTSFGRAHKLAGKVAGLKTDRRVVVKFFSAGPG